MASYPAVIELRVDGVTQVTRVLDTINKLDNALVSIKKTPLAIDAKNATDGIRVLKAEVDKFVTGLSTAKTQLASTTAGLNSQAQAFKLLAANVKIGETAFKLYIQAAEQARQKTSLKGGLAEIEALASLYKVGRTAPMQSFQGIEELLALGNKLPNNVASLELYRSELQKVLSLVEIGSAEFNQLAAAIEKVDRALQPPTTPRGPTSPIGGRIDIPGSPAALKDEEKKRGKRLENIALGVGFPLLFGGGAGEVLGSLAGSFVGEGFGGQIFGGAIGGIIDDFITKAGELGTALNPATANIEELVKALGGTTTEAGAYIAKLDELGQSQEALKVATAELENLVGVQGVEALRTFGEDSTKLQSVFGQAMTQMQASVAELINSTGILKAITGGIESNVLLRQGLQSKDPRQQELVRQREAASGPAFFGADPAKYFAAEEKIIQNQRLINAEKQKQYEAQTKILTAEEKTQEILKETKKLAGEIKTTYQEIGNEARKRIETEQASLERGQAVAQARYTAEKALLDLNTQQLERAYEYAETQKDRYNLAIALFNNAVQTAKIEYNQQLESIAAAERKLQVEIQELQIAQSRVKLKADELKLDALKEKDEERRAAIVGEIDGRTKDYLNTSNQVIDKVQKQLEAQQLIGEYQKQTAEAQLQSKILAAQTALEQRLVSKEIGLATQKATALSSSLAAGAYNANQMAGALGSVAQQAGRAVVELSRIESIRSHNVTAQSGYEATYQYSDGTTGYANIQAHYAKGGYVTGPTRALIGEGGESEYIIPASKMDEAMSRYAQGQRGSSVIPSSINPQVNVTTGPVMNMNGSNYVSQQDFMAGLQIASRRGAQMALSAMRGNGGIRRSVGAR